MKIIVTILERFQTKGYCRYRLLRNKMKKIAIFAVLLIFIIRVIILINSYSLTADEPVYMALGHIQLTKNAFFELRNPPLVRVIQAIPLLFTKAESPTLTDELLSLQNKYIIGERFVYHNSVSAQTIITLTRIMTFLLSLFLGYFVFLFSSQFNSSKLAGILSVFVYTFSPNIIGYSALTTTDIGSALFFFMAIYYFWKLSQFPDSKLNLMFFGLSLGAALSSKFSNIIIIPTLILLFIIFRKLYKSVTLNKILISIALLFAVILLTNNISLKPYYDGLKLTFTDITEIGHDNYFMGMLSNKGWWYYYIVSFFITTPIPVILLFLTALLLSLKDKIFNKYILFVYLPIIIYFVIVSTSIKQSPRYLLPIYPFLFVAIGNCVKIRRKLFEKMIPVLSIWLIIISLWIHPYYLNYCNEIIGGPKNGYKYLTLDWGQNLNFLKDYLAKNGVKYLVLNYSGGASLVHQNMDYQSLFQNDLCPYKKNNINPTEGDKEYLAISWGSLSGQVISGDKTVFLRSISKFEPLKIVGYDIFVYDISSSPEIHEELAILYLCYNSDKRFAARECQRVIKMFPERPLPYFILSLACAVEDANNSIFYYNEYSKRNPDSVENEFIGKISLMQDEYNKKVIATRLVVLANALIIHNKKNRNDLQSAAELCENSIKIYSEIPESYNTAGVAYKDLGKYSKSIEMLNQGLLITPINSKLYLMIRNNLNLVKNSN
ncbi:MAG: hypothetical protein A2252_04155 [Elusimicrobia bacterium RIFOXYA2_FULL_39_19]|nr:MAG: hypothetical protein A2252_04155 [Elusimicrobia bacterium RIFOXYA2_FULL_39_19]